MKQNRSWKIIKVAQKIKSNVGNGGKIWEWNKNFREKIKHFILLSVKKKRNRMLIADYRRIQKTS